MNNEGIDVVKRKQDKLSSTIERKTADNHTCEGDNEIAAMLMDLASLIGKFKQIPDEHILKFSSRRPTDKSQV